MIKDSRNSFLISLNNLLNNCFDSIKKLMTQINKEIIDLSLLEKINKDENLKTEESNLNVKIFGTKNENSKLNLLQNLIRMIQLFCEGHNLSMQNHLREQIILKSKSHLSINFIATISNQFRHYVKFVNIKCVNLGNSILDFLIESIQGPCRQNQIELSRLRIIEICKDFLAKFQKTNDYQSGGFNCEEDITLVNNLVTKSSNLLISLTEGVSNFEIIHSMCKTLDIHYLLKRLSQEYVELATRLKATSLKPFTVSSSLGKYFDDDLMEAFNVYILILILSSKNDIIKNIFNYYRDGDMKNVLNFFKSHIGFIEIVFNDELVPVFFPIQPICKLLIFFN